MRRIPRSVILFCTLFVLLFCSFQSAYPQDGISRKGQYLDFMIFGTEEDTSIHDIISGGHTFIEPTDYKGKTHPKDNFWIRIDFGNQLQNLVSDSTFYLKTPGFSYASMFRMEGEMISERKFGRFEHLPSKRSVVSSPGVPFQKNSLIKGRFIFLKVKRVIFFDRPANWKISYRSGFNEVLRRDFYSERDLDTLRPMYIFAGICSIIFILTLTYFIYSRRTEFLYYPIYVMGLLLYLTADIFRLHEFFFGEYSLVSYTVFFELQVVINLAYTLFVIHYLDTKSNYPKLHVPLQAISLFLILVILLDVVLLAMGSFAVHLHLLNIERLVMTVFGIVGMTYLLIKAKNNLAYFVVIGSFCYMFGALGLLFFGNRLYMITGGSLEIMIFAAGLTYKVQSEYRERLRFETEANTNRNKALRAQINPHFIFNSLTSIQQLVNNNDRTGTLKYLSRFSRLTRNVLESSMDTSVLLEDEIKMLEDYLELESLRFPDEFSYELLVSPSLEAQSIEIPFMLTQPFVENAIKHGLLPKKTGPRKLSIAFEKREGFLVCSVDDNGVGRNSSRKSKVGDSLQESRGLEISKQRLKKIGNSISPLEIIDKFDEEGNPVGTKVNLYIPIN